MRTASAFAMRIVREATRLDRSGIEFGFGARCAIGVAVPLVIGLYADHPLYGVSAAIGALPVGFASRQGVYRSRAAAALMTAVGVAVSAFVGAICGGTAWAAVLAAIVWGFAYGTLASLGPSAVAVGVNSVVALSIFGQFHDTPSEALVTAGLVLAGGLLQTLLLVSVWPFERFTRERTVLSAAYRTLATYAAQFPEAKLRAPDTATLSKLAETLADPQPFGSRGEIAAFEALLAEAERIRASLAALASDRYVLVIAHGSHAVSDAIEQIGVATHGVLAEIADALADARAPQSKDDATWSAFNAPIASLETLRTEGATRALGDAEALLGQLRSAWRAATTPAESTNDGPRDERALRDPRPSLIAEALATVRANLSFRSGFARHGIRLAVVLGLATLAAHVLPLQRGYWIALTVALVLRNDFATTFTRGIARILGTLAGGIVASLVAHAVHPFPESLLLLAVAFAFAGYVVFNANYAAFSLAVTCYVVFLLAFGGLSEHVALIDRVEETLIGGALALGAYAVWPTWERSLAPERLAELLEKQRRFASLVLRAYVDPETADERRIRTAQRESWLARTTAEESVDRMLAEPVRPRAVTVRAALGILAASRRFGIAALGLQTRAARAHGIPREKLAELANEIDTSLSILSEALRRHADPEPLPHLRDAQIALAKRLASSPDGDETALAADTDLMVDSVNTMAHVLHRLHERDAETQFNRG